MGGCGQLEKLEGKGLIVLYENGNDGNNGNGNYGNNGYYVDTTFSWPIPLGSQSQAPVEEEYPPITLGDKFTDLDKECDTPDTEETCVIESDECSQ